MGTGLEGWSAFTLQLARIMQAGGCLVAVARGTLCSVDSQ